MTPARRRRMILPKRHKDRTSQTHKASIEICEPSDIRHTYTDTNTTQTHKISCPSEAILRYICSYIVGSLGYCCLEYTR